MILAEEISDWWRLRSQAREREWGRPGCRTCAHLGVTGTEGRGVAAKQVVSDGVGFHGRRAQGAQTQHLQVFGLTLATGASSSAKGAGWVFRHCRGPDPVAFSYFALPALSNLFLGPRSSAAVKTLAA